MKRTLTIAACAFALPGATLAATHAYQAAAFDKVSVAEGIAADITLGPSRSVIAETKSDQDNFDDLRISIKDNVLQIDRPASTWFSFGKHPGYQVHVVTPALHSVAASSGAKVTVKGVEGDLSVTASSGSDINASMVRGGNVKASTSSGSDVSIAGSCTSLVAEVSSGSGLDAEDLKCENVALQASSGSHTSIAATKSVSGHASSGSDVRVRGKPATVQVDTSSGAHLVVRE
jgi:Putative auto-transporter adhesin, head GIN domain